jgi:predicted Zn-dependent protease
METRSLLIIEFGGADMVRSLTPVLGARFSVAVTEAKAPDPWARRRDWQANAEDVLSEVMAMRVRVVASWALGLTGDDLFVPGMSFVFGLASREAGAAVVSLNRLRDKDDQVYLGRLTKESVHEIGHLQGLPHCDDPGCVMHFSNTLADTDAKGADFCSKCSARLSSK